MSLRNDLRKYWDYLFDASSFDPRPTTARLSGRALEVAGAIRGRALSPALIIHGVMPRSGTVYVGELLRLHPDLSAYPNEIWEFPFLQQTGKVRSLQSRFLLAYEQNTGKVGEDDFLPLFGSALMAYLYSFVPSGQRMLLKVPSVQYLTHFFSVFPSEHLLLLVRDGRDVVHSTLRTWPQLRFSMVCRRWRRAAEMALGFDALHGSHGQGYWMGRFEDAFADPAGFVAQACARYGLDAGRYPFSQIEGIRIHGSSSLRARGQVVWDPLEPPTGFSPVGHWQRWSGRKKRAFKRIAGQALIDLGYCEDLDW